MSKYLTKEQIVGINDLTIEVLYVKSWKTTVRLKTPSSKQRDHFEKQIFGKGDGTEKEKAEALKNFRAKLVALVLVDGEGNRIFTSDESVEKLGEKSASAMDCIFAKAQNLCGITKEDVDDMTKNLKSQSKDSDLD